MKGTGVGGAEHWDAVVIGAGPAGLMAADMLSAAGHSVLLAEAMPSPARKFLMAGKSGLNLTKDEPAAAFAARISAPWLRAVVEGFGPQEVMRWAGDLGQPLFTGSSGRVFPEVMKASPLLRAWLARLAAQQVQLRRGWRWTGWAEAGATENGRAEGAETDGAETGGAETGALCFATPGGERSCRAGVVVLALGGASWPRLGSDAGWVPLLTGRGVAVAPFRPANMGFAIGWSDHMAPHIGQPVKNVGLSAGPLQERGEFVLSRRGIEGGGIYAVSAALRDGAPLMIDLLPDLDPAQIAGRLQGGRRGESLGNRLRKALGLDPVKRALLQEWARPLPADPGALAALLKALPVPLGPPHPLAEAISSAGGIRAEALSGDLELTALPGIFAAGEMLDWEAPTGGYLITTCLATGRHAGLAALRRLKEQSAAQ